MKKPRQSVSLEKVKGGDTFRLMEKLLPAMDSTYIEVTLGQRLGGTSSSGLGYSGMCMELMEMVTEMPGMPSRMAILGGRCLICGVPIRLNRWDSVRERSKQDAASGGRWGF